MTTNNGRLDTVFADLARLNQRVAALERHINGVYGTAFPLEGGNDAFDEERPQDQKEDESDLREEARGEGFLRLSEQRQNQRSASEKEKIARDEFFGLLQTTCQHVMEMKRWVATHEDALDRVNKRLERIEIKLTERITPWWRFW